MHQILMTHKGEMSRHPIPLIHEWIPQGIKHGIKHAYNIGIGLAAAMNNYLRAIRIEIQTPAIGPSRGNRVKGIHNGDYVYHSEPTPFSMGNANLCGAASIMRKGSSLEGHCQRSIYELRYFFKLSPGKPNIPWHPSSHLIKDRAIGACQKWFFLPDGPVYGSHPYKRDHAEDGVHDRKRPAYTIQAQNEQDTPHIHGIPRKAIYAGSIEASPPIDEGNHGN